MKTSNDKEEYLRYSIKLGLFFLGELRIRQLCNLAKNRALGDEYYFCSFEPDDEYYRDGFITLIFWKPALDEDTIVYIENNRFYEYLSNVCKDYIKTNSNDREKILNYLQQIKDNLLL